MRATRRAECGRHGAGPHDIWTGASIQMRSRRKRRVARILLLDVNGDFPPPSHSPPRRPRRGHSPIRMRASDRSRPHGHGRDAAFRVGSFLDTRCSTFLLLQQREKLGKLQPPLPLYISSPRVCMNSEDSQQHTRARRESTTPTDGGGPVRRPVPPPSQRQSDAAASALPRLRPSEPPASSRAGKARWQGAATL